MYINSDLTDLYRNASSLSIRIYYKGRLVIVNKTDPNWNEANRFYNAYRMTPKADRATATITIPAWLIGVVPTPADSPFEETATATAPIEEVKIDPSKELKKGLSLLLDFFTEFDFVPSYRFTNTLAFLAVNGIKSVRTYIHNYFELMGSNYVEDVAQKTESQEFADLIGKIAQYGVPSFHVNDRFKVYFGSAGTGKTTLAQTETDNRCIVCNSSMLPADLMENFVFRDGKPDFNPSILWECMEQGKPIVLDEINLLPFDSLRFLQGIVDGKSSFIYKNRPVTINKGFKIIGTMNLTLGGVTYGLPEPLVDRCETIRSFTLTAEQLMGAVTGEFVAG